VLVEQPKCIDCIRLFEYFEGKKINWIIFYSARCTYLRSYYNRNRDFKMNYGNHWDIIKDHYVIKFVSDLRQVGIDAINKITKLLII
jgi:hypothetical protein